MKNFFSFIIIMGLFVSCTDDVITLVDQNRDRTIPSHLFPLDNPDVALLESECNGTVYVSYSWVDGNYNDVLDPWESYEIQWISCGLAGEDGRDGYNVLVSISNSKACSNGGSFISFYHDVNFNSIVDEEDNYLNGYNVCNGLDGIDAFGLVSSIGVNGSCTVVELYLDMDRSGDVSALDIPQSSFTVCNGADGQDGADGTNGQNGSNAPLLLVESFQIAPLAQELLFYLDLDGDFALTGVDIVVERIIVRDGEQGVQGIQGPQGERGPAGQDGLDAIAPPALSVHTEEYDGFTTFVFYYDNNNSGTWDEGDDLASAGKIYDGEDGLNGATGDTGANGVDGYSWLFTSAVVVADPYCSAETEVTVSYNGTDEASRITFISWIQTESGIQAKWRIRNGQDVSIYNVIAQVGNETPIYLSNEIAANTEVFFLTDSGYNGVSLKWDGGSKGTASSGNKPEEAEQACTTGLFLFGGLDTDRSNTLEESEITLSQLIPAGQDGTDGQDGQDFVGSTTEYIDPLPNVAPVAGKHKELLMKVTSPNGDVHFYAIYYDAAKKRTFLSELFPGIRYGTTDGRSGTFKVDNL